MAYYGIGAAATGGFTKSYQRGMELIFQKQKSDNYQRYLQSMLDLRQKASDRGRFRQFTLDGRRYEQDLDAPGIAPKVIAEAPKQPLPEIPADYKRPSLTISPTNKITRRYDPPKRFTASEISETLFSITHDRAGEPLKKVNPILLEGLRIDAKKAGYKIIKTKGVDRQWPISNIPATYRIESTGNIPFNGAIKNQTDVGSPFPEYPDAFLEDGVWKVMKNGQKYRIEK